MTKKITIVLMLIIVIGCTKSKNDIAEITYICKNIAEDSVKIKSLLILKTIDIPTFKKKAKGYLVGPFYKGLLLPPNNKFILSQNIKLIYNDNYTSLYIYDKTKSRKEKMDVCFCDQDSIPILFDNDKDTAFITKDAFINYIKRAKLYEIVEKQLLINNQPDTLVLPICKKDTLHGE